MSKDTAKLQYQCSKCGCRKADIGEFHAAGSTLGKLFDIQGRRFTTLTCTRCGFIDLYKGDKSSVSTLFDLLAS